MKFLIVIALSCIVGLAWSQKYTDKWDHINVDEILESDRLLKGYVDCLMDKGRCTPDAKTLKDTIPDALENDCKKCTEKQKEGSDKILRNLVNKRPALWKELATKYDPNDQYQQKYKDRIEAAKN